MKLIRFVEIFCFVVVGAFISAPDTAAQGHGQGHGGNGDRGGGREVRADRGKQQVQKQRQRGVQQERRQAPQRAYQRTQQRAERSNRDNTGRWTKGTRRDNGNSSEVLRQRAEQARNVQIERRGRERNRSSRGSDPSFRQAASIRDRARQRENGNGRNSREARIEERGRVERQPEGRTVPWFRQPAFTRDQDRNRAKRNDKNARETRIEQRGRDQRQATRGSDPWFRQRDLMRAQVRRSGSNDRRDRIFSRRGKDERAIYRDLENRGGYAYARDGRRAGRDRDSSYYDRRDNWRERSDRRGNAWFYDSYGSRYKNYGQYRSAQVHRRNEERKWARNYGSFWGRDYRDRDDDYWRRRSVWRDNVVRNIIVDPWYYASYDRYYPVRRYRRNDGFRLYISYTNYAPNYYGYSTYDPYYDGYVSYDPYYRYQRYPEYGYASYQDPYYDPYYSPAYYDDPYYDPYRRTSPYRAIGSAIGALPIAQILYQVTGNGVASEIVGGFLSQAYYQGYEAGRYARRRGYSDVYYDPYDRGYDGYSANLAENRRVFSQGYSLGYQDAMERRSGYEPYLDRSPDLVSMFVGLSL